MAELRQTFRPEFLNRIDDIIVFRALTEQDIEEVASRMLKTGDTAKLAVEDNKLVVTKRSFRGNS